MGARQSRRSVDITTTPKKEGLPAEGGVGDAAAPGDGKLERIEETDTKPTTNGIAPHTDVVEDKDKDKDDATEKEKDKEKQQEEVKVEETKQESAGESAAETAEVTTPTEANTPASPTTATSPDSKETKKKEKMKKKWSFRSISFSKKDKNKPAREEAPKNGDVTKEEPLAEGGEEAENGSATAGSPVEEKSAVSSPTAENEAAPVAAVAAVAAVATVAEPATTETKEESPASAASSPTEEKTEEPTPSAPTPVPVEEKKEEVEKVEAEKKVVEVSPAGGQFVPEPVEVSVFRVQTVATPSIIERKTSEDIPSLPPSSPPPTPIDSSPLQQAQQAAATATALAEALMLPAEAADKDLTSPPPALSSLCPERNDPSTPAAESLAATPQRPPSSSVHEPQIESILAPPSAQALPVVDSDASNPPVATEQNLESLSAGDGNKNTDVDPPSPPQTDASIVRDHLPAKEPEPSLPETIDNPENTVTEPPISKETNLEVSSEIKMDQKIEPPSRAIISENVEMVEIVEQSVEPSSKAQNEDGPKSIEIETLEAVEECTVAKEVVQCSEEMVPEPVNVKEQEEELVEQVIEPEQVTREGIPPMEEAIILADATIDAVVESEEGPIPVSEEILVEAKPAVVIPEDDDATTETVDDIADTDADVSRVDTESVEVVPDVEDKLETETEFDIAVPTEEILVSEKTEEIEDSFVANETTTDPIQSISDSTLENVCSKIVDTPESTTNEEDSMPPPLPESPVPSPLENFDSENANVADDSNTVPCPVVDVEPQTLDVESTQEVDGNPVSLPVQQFETASEAFATDMIAAPQANDASLQIADDSLSCPVVSEKETNLSSSRLEHVPSPTDDLPQTAVPEETIQRVDSRTCPLPPEELSCSLNVSEMKSELPVPDENAPSLRNPTETLLLTPPRSPSPQSNVSITSGLTTSTKDSSQTQLYDDQSNREFKMESVSISLNSYNESDIELKERLAESLAETEKQEESSVSCQLSNNATSSTTIQETHQSTPEPEAPVENNVARDSTTESSGEVIKVTTPAVPSEVVPASPPSAPAITEDVASVAKAIEEMDISDKAVAAATIECNTNEIIADAHYQNNINK